MGLLIGVAVSSTDKIDDIGGLWRDIVSHDGIYAVDSQQRIIFWSKSAQQIVGHRPEEVIGKLCYEVIGGRDARNFQACRRNCPTIVNARRGRSTSNYDALYPTPSGEPKWLNISTAVLGKKGHPLKVLHMFRDVSQRRHIEESAERVSTKLRQVISEETNPSVNPEEPGSQPLLKLSPRELETLRLLACGQSTKEIAADLGVNPLTARNHVSRLLLKLGAENRLQAILIASGRHLI